MEDALKSRNMSKPRKSVLTQSNPVVSVDSEGNLHGTIPEINISPNKTKYRDENAYNALRSSLISRGYYNAANYLDEHKHLGPYPAMQALNEEVSRQQDTRRAQEHSNTVSQKEDYQNVARFMAGVTTLPVLPTIAPIASTVVSDVTGVGLPFWRNVAKETAAGLLGSEALNLGSEVVTGKPFDQHINESLQQLGVNQTVSDIASPFFNPGGWLTWGLSNRMYNNLRSAFTPNKSNVLKHSEVEYPIAVASPAQEAPFSEVIQPHRTYKPFNRQAFEEMDNVQLQKRAFQSYRDYSWIDHGMYDNPDWKEFYETILKPLNPNSELPKTKPRLVNFSNQSSVKGLFIPGYDIPLIDLDAGVSTGVHEYVSHGTDKFANPRAWEHTFHQTTDPFVHRYFDNSLDWREQRATVNEAKFQIFSQLKDKLGRKPTLDEFQNYIDNLTDSQLANTVLFKHPTNRTPRNAYVYDYYYNIKNHNTNSSKIAERLRHNMKYVFGLPLLPILPLLNNTQEN